MIGASRAASTREYQLLDMVTITSTGAQSYTIPAGVVHLEVEMWGGGAGGGAGDSAGGRGGAVHHGGGGGGGGAYVKHKYQLSNMQPSDTLNFTVGAGGAGATTVGGINTKGTDGGATTIDTHKRSSTTITTFSSISAGGGIGGRCQGILLNSPPDFSAGGSATNGNITNTDGTDGTGLQSSSGSAQNGNAGGAGANGGAGGAGGIASNSNPGGSAGTVAGGGGGGGASDCTAGVCLTSEPFDGGAGANGKAIVKAYG
jgi:hypothetical protein